MNDEQLLRYSRHILLPELDVLGQQRLLNSRVLIIGAGGLGAPVAMYLAAAGVGTLHLADDDQVDITNLQRQIIHREDQVGQPKVDSAALSLAALSSSTRVITSAQRLTGSALIEAVAAADLVCDCSDRFSTRFAVNRACVEQGRPLVSGAAIRLSGQLLVVDPRQAASPCYACLYDEQAADEELNCSTSGVLGPLVGVIGSLQAVEALKLLAQVGTPSVGRLLTYDALRADWRSLQVVQDPACFCTSAVAASHGNH